jgi:hypothetical protein
MWGQSNSLASRQAAHTSSMVMFLKSGAPLGFLARRSWLKKLFCAENELAAYKKAVWGARLF